jgi:hypothetical protein
MKFNRKNTFVLMAVVLSAIFVGSAFAGASAGKSNEQKNKNYAMIEGVLALKEGHGDFLIRLPDGKAQRFSVKTGAEITRNGKPARYNELKVRDSIQVQYDVTNRKVIAIHASGF